MTEKKIAVDEILARWKQNAEGFRVYDANDGGGFALRTPRGFVMTNAEKDTWINGAVQCLNDIPDAVKLAHVYRDCFENERKVFQNERVVFQSAMAQHKIAMIALREIARKPGRFATSLCARQAIAVIDDGSKSVLDWSNEYKA